MCLGGRDHQIARAIEVEARAWWNDGGCAVFGDDCGAEIFLADGERTTVVDCGLETFAVEDDGLEFCSRGRRASGLHD